MKQFLIIVVLFFSCNLFAQDDIIAKEYFKNGEFEKALFEYTRLLNENPLNINYTLQLVETYRQLERYDEAEALLLQSITKITYPGYYVELGYNYQLKGDLDKAEENYQIALQSIDGNPGNVYSVARFFEEYSILDHAIEAYTKAVELNPNLNFDMQLARIYGDKGDIEKMFDSYLDFTLRNPSQVTGIKRAISDFITEDPQNENNLLLKRLLLKKIQENPDIMYNEMLSWLFVQQKEFKKAYAQEKAIFTRQPESLNRLEELAQTSYDSDDIETAKEIYTFIIKTSQDKDTQLRAYYNVLNMETEIAEPSEYETIKNNYLSIFETYGKFEQTLDLQVSYAHFMAFYLHEPNDASAFLKESLELPLSLFAEAKVKMELGDILVLQERFNEALIYYTQIQRNLKNSTLSQNARFKVAQTSYYKGDFDWAESQLKILKASTSQLIANDALDLKLMISDNKYEDSTHTALKLYAKADLLSYQNKTNEAITILQTILDNHKGETIEDQALLKQAQLFESKKDYDKAVANYLRIVTEFNEDILADDAYFALGELYAKKLDNPELAKSYYEKIIFNYADSIYFVEAQKQFRMLRGDDIN